MRRWVLLLLMGISMGSWAQWSIDLAQNTRVSAGFMHTFAYGAVAGDDGSVLIMWAESVGNASIMYAQRYRVDGTIAFAKKEVFRYTFGNCQKEGFAGMRLLKAAGSDDVFAIFTLTTSIVVQGGLTTYLQYQIVSFADGSTKIPNTGNENRGLNLGYNYDTSAPNIPFDANFIRDGGNRVVVTWHQKNNPADINRGGGGSPVTITDLRIAILDASNRTAPTAYFIEGDGGDQTNPRVYAQGERIFVSFVDRNSTIAVRKYKYPLGGSTITREWGGNAQYLGGFSNVQNLGVQPSLDDTNPLCVYTASGTGLSKTLRAHRFNPASGAALGNVDIGSADQIGFVKTTSGAFSLNFNIIHSKGNRQVIRRYLGSTTASAETSITTRNHGGDPTFEGIKISDSPERYLLVGENRENGELYGQVIRFNDNSSEGVREWGDAGKIVSNAGGNKTGGRLTVLNSNALLFLWKDERNKNSPCTSDIYAQVLDANGNVLPSSKVEFRTPEIVSSRPAELREFQFSSSVTARAVCSSDTFQINFRTSGTFPAGTRIKVYLEALNGPNTLSEIQDFDAATVGDFQTARRSFTNIPSLSGGFFQLKIRAENGTTVLASAVSADKYYHTASPSSPIIRSSNGQLTSCGNITLLGTPISAISGHSFDWQRNNVNVLSSATNTVDSLIVTPVMGSGNYSLIAWSGTTCLRCSTKICPTRSNVLAVQFTNSSVSAPTVTATVSYCVGQSAVPLTATGTNLKWYTAATDGVGGSTAPAPTTVAAGTTSYFVSQTVGGCESTRAEIKVTVTSTPTIAATANTTKPLSVCAGTNVTLGRYGRVYLLQLAGTGRIYQHNP